MRIRTPWIAVAPVLGSRVLFAQEARAKARGRPADRAHHAIPRANHYVFLSNEGDVLRETETFIGSLNR